MKVLLWHYNDNDNDNVNNFLIIIEHYIMNDVSALQLHTYWMQMNTHTYIYTMKYITHTHIHVSRHFSTDTICYMYTFTQ